MLAWPDRRAINQPCRSLNVAEQRCNWATTSEALAHYHDTEWGVPSRNDQHLFEMLVLEGAQAGLSWSTILNKRAGYRRAFSNFDIDKVARFTPKKIDALVLDEGIVRHRGKIESTVLNAKAVRQIQTEHGSLADFVWSFVDNTPIQNAWTSYTHAPASTEVSDALSKALKGYGCKFVGTTICYAFMQAVGMVNDHQTDCACYSRCALLGKKGRKKSAK
ncbi:DNA-3-methyladenine glycosylase I [Paraburkholderia hospita]|jgi:DNA-3-methyladenine glycosylase I|uniref:DNA-3-methyladenine glycosylase I n=1 Tax=Paraburkholderia hospita TaxID=169430 RepID=UPI0015C49F44|nr:DNA-3-methyladenine glycosylase I [Paraburkholderia hospita]